MDLFRYDFMIRAFVAGTLLGLVAPMLGTFAVARRSSTIADTLAHAALAGVGVGVLAGFSPTWGAVLVSIMAALGIEWMIRQQRFNTDAIMALFLSGGLALAVALVTLKGTPINFENYLFGSLLTVTTQEVLFLVLTSAGMILFMNLFWWNLLSMSFNEELTSTRGIPVSMLRIALAFLTALLVSQSLKIVGGLLVGALMVIPVLIAIPMCKSFRSTFRGSLVFGLLSVWSGLLVSYYFNFPSGSAIVLTSVVIFMITYLFRKIL